MNRDQLRNPTLGNRVWATFFISYRMYCSLLSSHHPNTLFTVTVVLSVPAPGIEINLATLF